MFIINPDTLTLPDGTPVRVVAFYAPGSGLTACDLRTGGGPLANFWPLPEPIVLEHHNVSATFTNSEAAYQCLKWWQHAPTRETFEACSAPGLAGGEAAFQLKRLYEKDRQMAQWANDFDGLGKFGAMLLVLRRKWRVPGLRELLLSTAGQFLVEHSALHGRDPYWTDDRTGGGQNRLGAALMIVRDELLREQGGQSAWPVGVPRPAWLRDGGGDGGGDGGSGGGGGGDDAAWQSAVDHIATQLCALDDAAAPPSASAPMAGGLAGVATLLGILVGYAGCLVRLLVGGGVCGESGRAVGRAVSQRLLPFPQLSMLMNVAIVYSMWCYRHPWLSHCVNRAVTWVVNALGRANYVLHVPAEGMPTRRTLPPPLPGSARVALISDTHLCHDLVRVPACDVLVHCGDILLGGGTPFEAQLRHLDRFIAWLRVQPAAAKVVIGGNHDSILDPAISGAAAAADALARFDAAAADGVYFLHPARPNVRVGGLHVGGCSYSHRKDPAKAVNAAFQRPDAWVEPVACDLLVTHGPPRGVCEEEDDGCGPRGSEAILEYVRRTKPKLHAFGHAHMGYGHERDEHTTFVNASTCNAFWWAVHQPVVCDLRVRVQP